MEIYVVKPGDSVDTIAAAYGVLPESVIYNNQLIYPYRLAVGQALLLGEPESSQENRYIVANGYAYTYISPWVLQQTLPYLSELSVFSYGFSTGGYLIAPPMDDVWMVQAARQYNAVPVLTLTPFGVDGKFNNRLISAVVNNPAAKEQLITQLLQVMGEKGYGGLDIDFEYILAEDRDAFTQFVGEVTQRLNAYGYQVSVALAPKTSADQVGLLYEGKDYRGLGEAANQVLLMTYEWGYKYGPNMAVAPINMVRRVLDYAVTEIEPAKISLGIPNYGYDWPLPFVRGETEAVTIGNVEAVQIAITNNAAIQFDQTAMSPFFRYILEGIEHEVWFEDVRSLQAKFALIREYGLRGCGYWQIMRWFRANWMLLADTYRIEKNG
ncbi:MAG: glycosyl hydrolase family 18 protein [Lachnospiraceae bacterium]|jgi:spore germination protein|nr:glycosyl hydrolase family 18 protein [Lachnospiraceae bacterium]